MLSSVLGFLLTITIIVFVHELGHYVAARVCGVGVTEFSIGFGKSLFQIQDSRGTLWKICAIPLGGYVKMYGDKGVSSSEAIDSLSEMPTESKDKSFIYKSPYQRAFIAAAGPLANYILAIAILSSLYLLGGKYEVPSIVAKVVEGSAAYKAGLKEGDRIIAINNTEIKSFDEIFHKISLYPNTSVKIELIRENQLLTFKVITGEREIKNQRGKVIGKVGSLGIASSEPIHTDLGLLQALNTSLKDVWHMSIMTFTALEQIFTGARSMEELRGTITIAEQSGSSINHGLEYFLIFIASLSVNIGFVNLLPVPILDGGHIILCAYEMIFQKRPSLRVESVLNKIGLLFIIFLFVISTSNDIKALLF